MKLAGMLLWALLLSTTCGFANAQECKEYVAWLIHPSMGGESPVAKELHCQHQRKWVIDDSRNRTLAEMVVPPIASGLSVNYGGCRIGGTLRHDVIAIVRHNKEKEWSRAIKKVWEVSSTAFVPIKPRDITCRNEDFGV